MYGDGGGSFRVPDPISSFAMTRRRRFAVLALALPAWIVMILGGGEWCLMPGSASARQVSERGAHAAQAVAAVEHDAHSAHRGHQAARAGDDVSRHDVPASHHSGDARTCASPAACSVAVAPARWTLVARAPLPLRPLVGSVDRPTSIVLAPELPPPRA